MINQNSEPFVNAANKNIDAAYDFVQTSLESVEKLTRLQLESSKRFIDSTAAAVKEIASTHNPKDLFEKVNHLASTSVESNIANCHDVYEIITDAQAKFSKLIESQIQSAQKNVVETVDNLAKFAPHTSSPSVATDSIKNWLSTTSQAISALNKVASQVTEFTNSNIKAATKATENVVKKATKKTV